jgi:hypothetical protein
MQEIEKERKTPMYTSCCIGTSTRVTTHRSVGLRPQHACTTTHKGDKEDGAHPQLSNANHTHVDNKPTTWSYAIKENQRGRCHHTKKATTMWDPWPYYRRNKANHLTEWKHQGRANTTRRGHASSAVRHPPLVCRGFAIPATKLHTLKSFLKLPSR